VLCSACRTFSPLPRWRLCDHVGLSVILFVWSLRSHQLISLKVDVTSRQNWLTFAGDPIQDTDSGSLFHFTCHCGTRDLLAFLIQSPADFHDSWQYDWHRHGNESTAFCTDLADVQVWINPVIWIWIQITFGWG